MSMCVEVNRAWLFMNLRIIDCSLRMEARTCTKAHAPFERQAQTSDTVKKNRSAVSVPLMVGARAWASGR